MKWSNVKLIFQREVRDQLRDRRTLFMIAVLPLLLYPLMGMSMFQVLQFVTEHATRVLVIGTDGLPKSPKLIDGKHFAVAWFKEPDKARLLDLEFAEREPDPKGREDLALTRARREVQQGRYEAVVYFPPDFSKRLESFREQLSRRPAAMDPVPDAEPKQDSPRVPAPEIHYNTAQEKSQITFLRVSGVLDRWTEEIGRQNLASSHLPPSTAHPFELVEHDVADTSHRDAAMWSKILPFLLLVWALTGAFYPAIDLCAGEKERGTLETLLSSPALRTEIVWGKLLTVMLFSVATAVLNLLSMGITGSFVLSQLPELGPPPPLAPLWLAIALLPVSALFSALCLALAAFARSSKEGQYYLMPLMLCTLPLVILPMAPGVELTLGNSLIPLTGIMLFLRTLLEGNYLQAMPFLPPVVGVTLVCCLFAVRWAVDQFNSESVLFREGERLDLGLWLRHLLRDRQDTPNVATAVFCGAVILLIQFFMSVSMSGFAAHRSLTVVALVTQLAAIATPALLFTVMLTRSPKQTLLLHMPAWLTVPATVLLAVGLHPVVSQLRMVVMKLYPMSDQMKGQLEGLFKEPLPLWEMLLVVAVTPAICEELAFRGFILSGFRHLGHRRQAILFTSVFFALAHPILQQSVIAGLVGIVLGYLAVQTGSILPSLVFHMTHNALAVLSARLTTESFEQHTWLRVLARRLGEEGLEYQGAVVALGGVLSLALLAWFRHLPHGRSREEVIEEAMDHPEAVSTG